jgi:glutathione peroxidase-family protein
VYKSHFGALVEESTWDDITRKVITFPSEKFMKDYAQQAEHIRNLTKTL